MVPSMGQYKYTPSIPPLYPLSKKTKGAHTSEPCKGGKGPHEGPMNLLQEVALSKSVLCRDFGLGFRV